MKIFKDIEYLEIVKVQLTSYFASRKTYFEFEQKQKFIKILIFDKKQKKKDYSSFENLTIFQQIFIDPRRSGFNPSLLNIIKKYRDVKY